MLLRPLFFTSFLIDDQLADEGLATRGPVVISSASSKTAIAAAFLLAQREGVELVGLTSPRNAEFVEGLGIYGRTVPYDAIDSLERGPATYVDIAGDGEVRRAVHSHFGDELAPQHGGRRHPLGGDGRRRRRDCPGPSRSSSSPRPGSPSAPRTGAAPASRPRVADAWHPFCEWTEGWLETIPGEGFDAVAGRLAGRARGPGRATARARPLALVAPARRRASAAPWRGSPASRRGCRGGGGRPRGASRGRPAAGRRAGGTHARPCCRGRSSPSRRAVAPGRRPSSARSPRRRRRPAARPDTASRRRGQAPPPSASPTAVGQLLPGLAAVNRSSPRPALSLLRRHQPGAAQLPFVELVEHPAVPDAARTGIPSAASPWAKTWISLSEAPPSTTSISQMKVCEEKPRGFGVLAWWPISTTASSSPPLALVERGLRLDERQVGDRANLDPGRHPLAFDVGPDHVPVPDRDLARPRRRAAPRRRPAPRRSSACARERRRRGGRAGTRRSPRSRRSPPCPPRSSRPSRPPA